MKTCCGCGSFFTPSLAMVNQVEFHNTIVKDVGAKHVFGWICHKSSHNWDVTSTSKFLMHAEDGFLGRSFHLFFSFFSKPSHHLDHLTHEGSECSTLQRGFAINTALGITILEQETTLGIINHTLNGFITMVYHHTWSISLKIILYDDHGKKSASS